MSITTLLDNFHFIRPEWLFALIPAALLGFVLLKKRGSKDSTEWMRLVDSHLLKHMTVDASSEKRKRYLPPVIAAIVITGIAGVAGPSWQQSDVPTFKGGEPIVTVLSLAQSMNSKDLTPSRLQRSVHKLRDLLDRTHGDERGLVIYSDTPFVAAPLTSDPDVIEQMLPDLSTSLMPVLGNRLDKAITEAHELLSRANATRGSIVVIADHSGNDITATVAAAGDAHKDGFTVSVLGAGTVDGGLLQTADGRAISDRDGQTYTTALDVDALQKVAKAGGGTFSTITPGSSDLDKILPNSDISLAGDAQSFKADTHIDRGFLLLFIPLLLMPLLFRRGLVLSLAIVGASLTFQPQQAMAAGSTWDNLWATPDQQGQKAFSAGDYNSAAALFDSSQWRAASAYRKGDYTTAADIATTNYNRGNALAKAGRFEEALAAYDKELTAHPDDQDAQFNRDLVADLLEQQEQQQEPDSEQDQQQDQQSAQQDQQQQGGEQQSGEQQQNADSSQSDQQQGAQDQQSAEGSQADQQAVQEAGHQADQHKQSVDAQPEQQQGEQDALQQTASKEQSANQNPDGQQPGEQQQASAEPAEPGQQQTQNTADAFSEGSQETEEKDGLSQMLSQLLGNQTDEQSNASEEQVEAVARGAKPVDQAIEQQLRRVPDDPSGLLRARIRQHYSRTTNGAS